MNVVIVGAGPAGLFLAQRFLSRSPNYTVQIYDRDPDPTELEAFDSRGFGLGLGARVQHWLQSIEGLREELVNDGIEFTANGLILISRRQLCAALLRSLQAKNGDRAADPNLHQNSRLSVHFDAAVINIDLAHHEIVVERGAGAETVAYDLLVGADGIHSTIRSAMMRANPDQNQFQQRQRPQVWKVLQLPMPPDLQPAPQIIRLQTRHPEFGLIFGGCLPQKSEQFTALIFWQPLSRADQTNPAGITTVEQLQQLVREMTPKNIPPLQLDRDLAAEFLAAQPKHEYWSQCRSYHDLAGQAVLIGDAAHGMFSLLGQGCTAAIADAVALDALLQQHQDQLAIALPEFSARQVPEGHAASDLSLIALIVYHRWLSLLYIIATGFWVVLLRRPSIFARLGQVDASYVQILRENRGWIWLAKKTFIH